MAAVFLHCCPTWPLSRSAESGRVPCGPSAVVWAVAEDAASIVQPAVTVLSTYLLVLPATGLFLQRSSIAFSQLPPVYTLLTVSCSCPSLHPHADSCGDPQTLNTLVCYPPVPVDQGPTRTRFNQTPILIHQNTLTSKRGQLWRHILCL